MLGCGMQVQDVNRLLKQFDDMQHDEDEGRDGEDDENVKGILTRIWSLNDLMRQSY